MLQNVVQCNTGMQVCDKSHVHDVGAKVTGLFVVSVGNLSGALYVCMVVPRPS